ncbi:MAG: hypothetical protein RI556_08755 [Hydrogenovibrio sp.]|uniref:FAD-dependent oxidoreductase n=1 Tax=Hydrogenovibrio sp. TaxID=2065821 RepID=UPI00286FD298|nr:hypothetical protein [Hydrogenovibrio sp.]MDR9498519.1 hypothetical protein [Hydrogenovibrio sp.]MDR9499251.1 hypothetical protein [Hydrogenovibrio sp.]
MNISVIGGGINGIMTVWELLKHDHNVTLFELAQLLKPYIRIDKNSRRPEWMYKSRLELHDFLACKQCIMQSLSGLRSLIKNDENPNKAIREYAIQQDQNAITFLGGKWTAARQVGFQSVKEAVA